MPTITSYPFTINQLNSDQLTLQITSSLISTALAHIDTNGTSVNIFFKDVLSDADQITLNNLIAAYVYTAPILNPISVSVTTDATIQKDSDSATISRIKQAPSGYTYLLRGFEITTALVNSLFNQDDMGVDPGDIVVTYYDSTNAITNDLTTCVKTILDFEPAYDYYIIGGASKILTTPTTDVRLNIIVAPNIPASYGGSKKLVQNVNFKFLGMGDSIDADGRAAKQLTYSATQHTSKMRFIVTHPAGEQHNLEFILEYYRA